MRWTHDLIVIGAGSAGLTVAGGCARLGLRVALVERGRMGGECLNTGCVPSKALLAAAARAQAMRGTRLGIEGAEPRIDFAAVSAHVAATIAAIAPHDAAERFEAWGVEVIRASASFDGPQSMIVGDRRLAAPRIVLATGSRPRLPDVDGLDTTPYVTTETVFELETLPRHLLVLGGGAVGVEMAQAFRRLGAAVTLVDGGTILANADADAVEVIRQRLLTEGVTIHEGVPVTRMSAAADTVVLRHADGELARGSHLLLATGRQPSLEGLRLDLAGIESDASGIGVDAGLRTSNPHVYAIGDCRPGPRFTHAAGRDGALMVQRIGFGLPGKADDSTLPAVTYTSPELAQVGLTEAAARSRHERVSVVRHPFADNDRAVAEDETEGFVKLVRAGRRVVGVTIVGAGAGDQVLPWSLIMGTASLWGLSGAIVPYPTRSEIAKAVAFATYEPALFGRGARAWARLLAGTRRWRRPWVSG